MRNACTKELFSVFLLCNKQQITSVYRCEVYTCRLGVCAVWLKQTNKMWRTERTCSMVCVDKCNMVTGTAVHTMYSEDQLYGVGDTSKQDVNRTLHS